MALIERSVCQICSRSFDLTETQQAFVSRLKDRGQHFIMLECPHCGTSTHYAEGVDDRCQEQEQNLRCPAAHCSGWAVSVDDASPFTGCGECGSVWHSIDALQRDISSIVSRFPYRAACYKNTSGQWLPTELGSQPGDYEERVEQEPLH